MKITCFEQEIRFRRLKKRHFSKITSIPRAGIALQPQVNLFFPQRYHRVFFAEAIPDKSKAEEYTDTFEYVLMSNLFLQKYFEILSFLCWFLYFSSRKEWLKSKNSICFFSAVCILQ